MTKETKTADSRGEIYKALPKLIGSVHAVPKDQKNQHQNFMFRGIDGVYPVLRKALVEHKCSIIPRTEDIQVERVLIKDKVWCKVIVTTDFYIYASDGSHVVARFMGEGNDTSDKAVAKAHSNAYKKFAFDTFCVPTGEADPDHDDIQNVPRSGQTRATPPPPAASPANAAPAPNLKIEGNKLAACVSGMRRSLPEQNFEMDSLQLARSIIAAKMLRIGGKVTPEIIREAQVEVSQGLWSVIDGRAVEHVEEVDHGIVQ